LSEDIPRQDGAVVLVGVDFGLPHFDSALEELGLLAQTAGLTPVERLICKRKAPDAALFVGSGKADEIRELAELHRATRPGGSVLCSDVHPIGHALGWKRDFKADGQRYAVRHTQHLYSHWHAACAALGLAIEAVREPMLDPADIPAGAHFDPAALQVPVALVLRLRRLP
jgi:hypothetical protein